MLYERLGLKGGRKGKSGHYSTDVNELERLAAEGVEVARLVLDWRQLTKLRSTYTDALQAVINPETGRVHTSFSLSGAQTGRLSSNDPNLQNIPIRTEIGRKIRDAFVAEPGHVLMSADYSQIELRIAAHMADVPQLKEAFRNRDGHPQPHRRGIVRHGRPRHARQGEDGQFRDPLRRFGLGPRGAAWACPRKKARRSSPAISSASPASAPTSTTRWRSFARHGLHPDPVRPEDPFLPNIRSPAIRNHRGGAERAAINAPIQGTSADLIKRAMARMDEALAEAGLDDVRMLLQVHDELVFEVPEGREEEAAAVVRRVMETAAEPALKLDVPLDVEVGWGEHWGAAH